MKTDILCVRHGQSQANAQGYVGGVLDYPLTEQGIKEAYQVSESLKTMGRIGKIISSPLIRARHTAEIIAGSRGISVKVIPQLHEVGYGFDWYTRCPPEFESAFEAMIKQPLPSSETISSIFSRADNVLGYLRFYARITKDPIVVVGHNTFTSALFAFNEGIHPDNFPEYRKKWGIVNNASVTKLTLLHAS